MSDCVHCGEGATLRYLGEDLCEDCAPDEDMRFTCCSLCDAPMDIANSRLPLCPRCEGSCRAHAEYDRNAREFPDPERRERWAD